MASRRGNGGVDKMAAARATLSPEGIGDGLQRMLATGRPESGLNKQQRIKKAKSDFAFFCRYYLGQYFPAAPAPFHREISDLIMRHYRVVTAAPREHAKSTIVSFAFPLWSICFQLRHYIVIFRDSDDVARQQVDDIRRELEDNERILEDFGDLIGQRKWTESEFVTSTGVKVAGRGRGAAARGLRFKQFRPDLVIVDDIEDDEQAESKIQRNKLHRWFKRVVSNIIGPMGKLFVIGTILHNDAVLARLLREDVYQTRVWRAIEDGPGGKQVPLWPARWPLKRLEEKRREIGTRAFESEFMNNPANEEDQIFLPSWWRTFADEDLAGVKLDVVAAIDPAISQKAKADDTAVAVVARGAGRYYVLRVKMRKIRMTQQVDLVADTFADFPRISKFGVETVAYQDVLREAILERSRRDGLQIPAVAVEDISTDKVRRISRLAPLFEQGLILWPERASSFWSADIVRCQEQFEALGCSAESHDDGPDALERAVSLLRGKAAKKGRVHLV